MRCSRRADEIVRRDTKEYTLANGDTLAIAQIEVVGKALLDRGAELREALERMREADGHAFAALMVTDILSKGTDLLVAGDAAPVERAFGKSLENGALPLPAVMSRKKQVAPKLLGAFASEPMKLADVPFRSGWPGTTRTGVK